MEPYVRTPNCSCSVCGKQVYRRPKELASGSVYCSMGCYGKSCRKPTPCGVCGVEILAGKNAKTCSRTCSNKTRIGQIYKQGRPLKDKVVAHKALRSRIIQRDGTCCLRCKYDKTHLLHVHHILERAKGGTDDLENLELICPNCHAEEHYNRTQE